MNALERTIVAEGDSTHLERGGVATSSSYAPPAAASELEEQSLAAMLQRTPELMNDRSLVIERAVDEFLGLVGRNPALSPRDYSQRFAAFGSSIESSIYRQLEVEQYLGRRQSALGGLGEVRWPSPGDQAGSFEIIEELGRGALARVYLGRQLDVGRRQVVVKVCRSAAGEAHTLGQLRHRNIVPIFTVERDEHAHAAILCMPFLGRSTLFDLIDAAWDRGAPETGEVIPQAGRIWERPDDQVVPTTGHGPPNSKESFAECVVYLGVQLADALHHVHTQGVVHGDVKPSNVLLTPEGEPLLMDFNLSGNVALATTARGGTLPYMPPEQLREHCPNRRGFAERIRRPLGRFFVGSCALRTPERAPAVRRSRRATDDVASAASRLARTSASGLPAAARGQRRHSPHVGQDDATMPGLGAGTQVSISASSCAMRSRRN